MKYKTIAMSLILATALAACTSCAAQNSGNTAYEGSDDSNVQATSESITTVPSMESAADSTSTAPKEDSSGLPDVSQQRYDAEEAINLAG